MYVESHSFSPTHRQSAPSCRSWSAARRAAAKTHAQWRRDGIGVIRGRTCVGSQECERRWRWVFDSLERRIQRGRWSARRGLHLKDSSHRFVVRGEHLVTCDIFAQFDPVRVRRERAPEHAISPARDPLHIVRRSDTRFRSVGPGLVGMDERAGAARHLERWRVSGRCCGPAGEHPPLLQARPQLVSILVERIKLALARRARTAAWCCSKTRFLAALASTSSSMAPLLSSSAS